MKTLKILLFFISGFSGFPIDASSQNQSTENIIKIKHFPMVKGANAGERVTKDREGKDLPLPIITVHVNALGRLVDESEIMFDSYPAQSITYPEYFLPRHSTSYPAFCGCKIPSLNWQAVYTTFYVVLANDQEHMRLVRSCGKSPRSLGRGTAPPWLLLVPEDDKFPQYMDIKYIDNNNTNFINHAQMAQDVNGNVNEVIAAGEIDVVAGKIIYIDSNSGHFQPDVGSFLAYLKKLDDKKVLTLTKKLKDIIQLGTITEDEKNANLTKMKSADDLGLVDRFKLIPLRNYRPGTAGGWSYTTVFEAKSKKDLFTLTGGLISPNQDGIYVFKTGDILTLTKRQVKSILLTTFDPEHNFLDVQTGDDPEYKFQPYLKFWTEGSGSKSEFSLPIQEKTAIEYYKKYELGQGESRKLKNINQITISLRKTLKNSNFKDELSK